MEIKLQRKEFFGQNIVAPITATLTCYKYPELSDEFKKQVREMGSRKSYHSWLINQILSTGVDSMEAIEEIYQMIMPTPQCEDLIYYSRVHYPNVWPQGQKIDFATKTPYEFSVPSQTYNWTDIFGNLHELELAELNCEERSGWFPLQAEKLVLEPLDKGEKVVFDFGRTCNWVEVVFGLNSENNTRLTCYEYPQQS